MASGASWALARAFYFRVAAGNAGAEGALALDGAQGLEREGRSLEDPGDGAVLDAGQLEALAVEAAIWALVTFDLGVELVV